MKNLSNNSIFDGLKINDGIKSISIPSHDLVPSFQLNNGEANLNNSKKFVGTGNEREELTYSVATNANVQNLINKPEINIANFDANITISYGDKNYRFNTILLKRNDKETNKPNFEGTIILVDEDDQKTKITEINYAITFSINEETKVNTMTHSLIFQAFDASNYNNKESKQTGIYISFYGIYLTFFKGINDINQDWGNTLLEKTDALFASNHLLVTSKIDDNSTRTTGPLVGNLTNFSQFSDMKRISYEGLVRFLAKPNEDTSGVASFFIYSLEITKNLVESTDDKLIFDGRISYTVDNDATGKFYQEHSISTTFLVDSANDTATVSTISKIEINNSKTKGENTYGEITCAYNMAKFWK